MKYGKHLDAWSVVVIALTLALFVAALFYTGFTHELLLEAGVFLVSVKLILMAYKSSEANDALHAKLDAIEAVLGQLRESRATPNAPPGPLGDGGAQASA
jgi:hypothetical protein